MNTNILVPKKNIITNSVLLAFYLLLASHFSTPVLLNFFAFSFHFQHISIITFTSFLTSALTESNPWILIIDLLPHFFFGFDVETAIGSKKYMLALLFSALFTNFFTILTLFVINRFYNILSPNFLFAGSSPIVLLCISCFCMFFNAPILKFTNIASFALLGFVILYFIYGVLYHISVLIDLFYSILINFCVLKWIDPLISISQYFSIFIPHTSDNNYKELPQDPENENDNHSILETV